MEPSDALWERQRLLELEMIQEGHTPSICGTLTRWRRVTLGATTTARARLHQAASIARCRSRLDERRERASTGGAGRRHAALDSVQGYRL